MEVAYFVITRRRKACRLVPPQHGAARSAVLIARSARGGVAGGYVSPHGRQKDSLDCPERARFDAQPPKGPPGAGDLALSFGTAPLNQSGTWTADGGATIRVIC